MSRRAHLEGAAQSDNVGMEDCRQHFTLGANIVAVVLGQDALLAHHLHGVYLPTVLLADLKHLY